MPEIDVMPELSLASAAGLTGSGKPLSVTRLRKTYGGVTAVDEVSMEIAAGEFVTFLGSSGSGKTTTLMMIAGFCEPDSGNIVVGGRDVTRLAPQKRGLGFVFQQYLLFPHMTVWENVAFPLQLRGVSKAEQRRRVGETLEMAGLSAMARRRPRELSGGQQQRVALCRALVYRPPVILMDEPLGALDKKLRDQLQTEIKRIQQELGLTVIYVTHDQEEALVLSDRIAVMRDGRIDQFDTPQELFERPRTPFVADFLGAANFLPGHVEQQTSGHTLVRLDTGGVLKARPQAGTEGARVRAAVQPGRLALCPPDDGFCTGTVETVTYVGTLVRVTVRLLGGAATELVRLELPAGRAPDLGERIGLTADPANVSVFPDTEHGG
ncbi:ABC-type Fe3+/spermidine/putrescine transport system ATPase subunit [Streptomyces achromogenes]|uniref:ABC-type Fe3+/spermidine/putrescine transport system ATPase subunit n=1 Tax=Streptomyces achromogenes TaxID=67255 RepID=A0ABU0PTW3_STRAH|nr:ABC transporter ATP-binding protein [Streptomyces achromogenes]MDQ0681842.1 ABC-type Fe3+/spermidine/putrescine transport system ATPase subunit [Streptomyces achromogenes]MDQ0828996.1 ABC-type Fe3+/spermidine/putrescine transport system ATPase subunit [Streptomyces achromogenes]